jgi:hypothetical protein
MPKYAPATLRRDLVSTLLLLVILSVATAGRPNEFLHRCNQGMCGGENFMCIKTTTGGVRCWQDMFYGVGGGLTTEEIMNPVSGGDSSSGVYVGDDVSEVNACVDVPTLDQSGFIPWQISCSGITVCAINYGGTDVRCWGSDANGRAGDRQSITLKNPASSQIDWSQPTGGNVALPYGRVAHSIAVHGFGACVLLDSTDVKCWGLCDNFLCGDATKEWGPHVSLLFTFFLCFQLSVLVSTP